MSTRRARIGRAVAILAILAVGAAGTADAGGDRSCVTGHVPATFVLPDGSVHLPGTLTLCAERRLSPVQRLERVVVSGVPQGLFVACEFVAEGEGTPPYLTFHRALNGEWILVGLTLPSGLSGKPPLTARLADDRRVAELAMERRGEIPERFVSVGIDARVKLVAGR